MHRFRRYLRRRVRSIDVYATSLNSIDSSGEIRARSALEAGLALCDEQVVFQGSVENSSTVDISRFKRV